MYQASGDTDGRGMMQEMQMESGCVQQMSKFGSDHYFLNSRQKVMLCRVRISN